MIYPMPTEAAEIAHDQFTGTDPDVMYQRALDSLKDKAEDDPIRHLFPYLENDVWDLAQDAILLASLGYGSDGYMRVKDRVTDRLAVALRQFQDEKVDAEIERLVEEDREEAEDEEHPLCREHAQLGVGA